MFRLALACLFLASAATATAAPYDIARYESTGLGPVNVWWVETPGHSLVVIDTSRDATQASAAVAAIRATGKPVRAILITHPHPDHVTGVATFKAAFPGVPVIAQQGTADEIRADTQHLLASGPPIPAPDRIVDDSEFTIDGLRIAPRAMGAGESVAQTVYWLPQARLLFSADLATPERVPFLKEGRTKTWLGEIAALQEAYPADARTFPGHGPEGRLGAMAKAETAYLNGYRSGIAAAVAPGSDGGAVVTDAERARLASAMAARSGASIGVAGMPIEKLDKMNADGVAGEMGAPQPQ